MVDGEPGGRTPLRVFISYSHESEAHREAVRRLWSLLRECGIEAVLDLPAAAVRQDWTQWMCMQIREADYVLVIASPGYRRGGDGLAAPDDGRGVQFEAGLIRDMVFRDRAAGLRKVLPVLLPGATIDDVPQFLSPSSTDHYHVGDFTVTGAERLLRVLTSQPRDVDGPLGSLPVLPTTPERTSG